jgi:uncharacterized protein (UPF0335 family)
MADVGGVAGDRLKSFIERIERLEEEKRALAEDIKEVYAEAKGTGFDTKIMRQLIKIRKMDKDDLDEQETLRDVYMRAIGMLPMFDDTPKAPAPDEADRSANVATMAGTIAREAAAGNPEAVALVAASKVSPAVMMGTARAIVGGHRPERSEASLKARVGETIERVFTEAVDDGRIASGSVSINGRAVTGSRQ